jgi:hypothetical protein
MAGKGPSEDAEEAEGRPMGSSGGAGGSHSNDGGSSTGGGTASGGATGGTAAGGAAATGGTSSGGAAGGAPPAVDLSHLDADDVYILGTLSEGACYRDAVAPWNNPHVGAMGLPCNNTLLGINPVSGRIIYSTYEGQKDNLYELVVDGYAHGSDSYDYPGDPSANDVFIGASCSHGGGFVSPDTGDILDYCCVEKPCRYLWTDGSEFEREVGEMEIVHLGRGGTALLRELTSPSHVLDAEGAIVPITGALPPAFSAIRSHADGFRVLTAESSQDSGDHASLYHIGFDGVSAKLGDYEDAPATLDLAFNCVLGANDDYFCQATDRAIVFNDQIVRGTLGGTTTIVFDEERDQPTVKLHISYLATGP